MKDIISELVAAGIRPVDTPERRERARAALDTHPTSPGKSILIICCGDPCIDHERRRILSKPWPAPVNVEHRYRLQCQGDTIEFMLVHQIERRAFSQLYDEIYTCGSVYLPERMVHMLRDRLTNRREWPGYFSKFA